MDLITVEEFMKVDIRAGKVIKAEEFPGARKPAYRLWIDFGDIGIKKSSAQITGLYDKKSLVGRQVIAVTNFPPRQVADFMSEVLVLGAVCDNNAVVLLAPDSEVPPGTKIM